MIATVVTTSTVALATTLTGSLSLIGVVLLIGLLIQKEFHSSAQTAVSKRINQVLNIALPPLIISFVALVAVRIFDVLK
jgi:hypothetical protein